MCSPLRTSSSTGSPTPTSRSSRTSRTSTLAERLAERAPISGPVKAAFFNAGTEAVENAVKFARAYTGRPAVIAFEGAFPRPHAALALAHLEGASLQGGARPVRARGLPGPLPARLPRASRSRTRSPRSSGRSRRSSRPSPSRRSCSSRCRARVASSSLRPSSSPAYARSATPTGSCFVADEVQTGFGRTGRFFAIEHTGVEPDLICVAKSIANGPAALGRPRASRDHGRARSSAASAEPSSATRSLRLRRSPSST